MSVFEQLKKKPQKSEYVTIDGLKFLVTGKSLNDASKIAAKARKQNGMLDGDKLDRLLLEACVSDPETGQGMSADEWGSAERYTTGPLVSVCLSLCGFDKDDIQRDPKD